MSTKRPVVPGETIPPEVFAEVFKERARILGKEVVSIEAIRSPKMDEILNTPDEDLAFAQRNDKLTYADLDRIFQYENPYKD